MLRIALLNVNWMERMSSNHELYSGLPEVSDKIASRRLELVGYCRRHPELSVSQLVLWKPTHGHCGRGRPSTTYIDLLKRDTGMEDTSELESLMGDRKIWQSIVNARLRPPYIRSVS